MAKNIIYEPGSNLNVVVTDPAAPESGDAVRVGSLTGIALTKIGEGGNIATETTVNLGQFVAELPVVAEAGAITAWDALFYDDAIHKVNNDSANGYFYGFAMEDIGNGLTDTINVLHVPSPGAGTLGAGTVGAANLAANAVIEAKIAALAVTSGKIAAGAVTEAKIDPASLTGLIAKVVANANVIGGIPVLHRLNVAGGAAGDTDLVLTHKTRIIDVWAVHTGGAGEANDTLTVKNGANAITNAMAWSGADKALVRAGEIDDAQHEIAAGGTLRATTTDDDAGADVGAGVVYALGIRVA